MIPEVTTRPSFSVSRRWKLTPDGRRVSIELVYRETTNLAIDTHRTYGVVSRTLAIDGRIATMDEVKEALGSGPGA